MCPGVILFNMFQCEDNLLSVFFIFIGGVSELYYGSSAANGGDLMALTAQPVINVTCLFSSSPAWLSKDYV